MARGHEEGKVQGSTWEDESHTTQHYQQASHSNQDRLRELALKRIGQEFAPGGHKRGRPEMMRTHDGSPSWRDKRENKPILTHGDDIQMTSYSPREIEQMRATLIAKLTSLGQALSLTVNRYQRILFARAERKIIKQSDSDLLQQKVAEIAKKKIVSIVKNLDEADKIKGVISKEIAASESRANLETSGSIFTIANNNIQNITKAAESTINAAGDDKVREMFLYSSAQTEELSEATIDGWIRRLDSYMTVALYDSRAITTHELLDRIKQNDLQSEMDEVRISFPWKSQK